MSSRALYSDYDNDGSLGEDGGESPVMITTSTPSGAATRQSGGTDWGAVFSAAVPTAMSVYQQNQLTRMNVARINAGRAPLSADEFGANFRVPSAEVQIGASAQMQKMMLYAGLGVLALVGLKAAKII
jgi:hypothetical protein